ncbi:peroxidase family protein [Devosia sp. CN2-171]|uniref:peroxidase family protein n=1 Tax=Devosia sp. CN2-171 TaxID=3400909 RepID=UPI003BF8E04E
MKREEADILPLTGIMSGPGDDNPRIKAGYTFLGQFIDHDLTLDLTSLLEQQVDPMATTKFRTPALELDSLYGRGPGAQPALYDKDRFGRFLLNPEGNDLQRNAQGTALISEHRNDENRIVSQLHLLFLKFHNAVLDTLAVGADDQQKFEDAQRLVRWHYQWIVLNEFLPRTVGGDFMSEVLESTDPHHIGPAYMPVEFSGATYRFGHSQIRPGYAINDTEGAPLFPANPAAPPGNDLRGGRDFGGTLVVDWKHFFGEAPPAAGGAAVVQQSKKIDTKLSGPLLNLPNSVVPPTDLARSLAERNLKRGLRLRLPAGETIADYLGIERVPEAVVWEELPANAGLTPLWFYILKEAEVLHHGHHLGGVGAAVVAQTFANVVLADKASYLNNVPNWTPDLAVGGKFTMADLANFTLGTSIPNETLDFGPAAPARP